VSGIGNVISLAAGSDATLVVRRDGTVWGWGKNIHAVTPNGLNVESSLSPLRIPGLQNIVAVSISGNGAHFLALDRNGKAWSWGLNSSYQLGQGAKGHDSICSPAMVEELDGVKAVAAGATHSLALLGDGTIRTWGRNSSGQLGNGSGTDSAYPVKVVTGKAVAKNKRKGDQ
jgi:alpha-tubulin suppressor-like RCC1 family protein